MKFTLYRTTAAFQVPVGAVIKLTDIQAATRLHRLSPLKEKGAYAVNDMVEFKRGEIIGLEGQIPKGLQALLDPQEDQKVECPTI